MKHIVKIPVRFSDTDMLGHVNNARYFTFMEEARIDFFRNLLKSGATAFPLIVASAQVNFRAQTFFPQIVRVESWVSRWGNSSFDVASKMYDDDTDTLVFDGVVVLVHFDYEKQAATPVPEAYRNELLGYTHEAEEAQSK